MTVDAERRSQILVDVEGGWRELKETGACFFEKSFRMQPHAQGRNVKYNVLYLDVSLARRAAPDPKQR